MATCIREGCQRPVAVERQQRYCSEACKSIAYHERKAKGIVLPAVIGWREDRQCRQCGAGFTATASNRKQRFCSRPCVAAYQSEQAPMQECAECGGPYRKLGGTNRCESCRDPEIVPVRYACEGCLHAIPSARAALGYECRIWAASREKCDPLGVGRLRQEVRTG